MTGRRHFIELVLLIVLALGCAVPSSAQETQRQLTGQFITGFSGFDVSGDKLQSPYAGFNANFAGFVSDPRILTFDLNPTLVKGFQWAGPIAGPESNGINANSTFLGGSAIPLHLFFSRQNIPTPDLPQSGVNTQGLSRQQQSLGGDWAVRLKKLPVFGVHYSRSAYTAEFPNQVGNLDSNSQLFRVDSQYEIAKWQLNGNYTKQDDKADTLWGNTGDPLDPLGSQVERIRDRGFNFAAARRLPLDSNLLLTADSHELDLDTGSGPVGSSWVHGAGSFSSRPTERLTTNMQVGYVTNMADYTRQQILVGNPDPTGTGFNRTLDTGYINAGAGLSYRLVDHLYASGSYSTMRVVNDNNPLADAGDSNTVAAGLNLYHPVGGGQLFLGYAVSHSEIQFFGTDTKTLQNTISGGYAHALPWQLRFNANGSFTNNDISYTFTDNLRSYGGNVDISRRVTNGWELRGRADVRKRTYEFPQRNEFDYESFSLMASSKRLQLSLSKMFDSGLAYRFGNGVIIVPGGGGTPGGLPDFIDTHGDTLNVAAAYKVTRNLSVRGSLSRGFRSVDGDNDLFQRGVDVRMDYRFRKTMFAAGYDRRWQDFSHNPNFSYFARSFYVEMRRDFRLF